MFQIGTESQHHDIYGEKNAVKISTGDHWNFNCHKVKICCPANENIFQECKNKICASDKSFDSSVHSCKDVWLWLWSDNQNLTLTFYMSKMKRNSTRKSSYQIVIYSQLNRKNHLLFPGQFALWAIISPRLSGMQRSYHSDFLKAHWISLSAHHLLPGGKDIRNMRLLRRR